MLSIIQNQAEAITLKPPTLDLVFWLPRRLNIPIDRIPQIYTENPRLLTICPSSMMPKKYYLFEKMNIDKTQMAKMFEEHPRIWVKSYGSNSLKLKYLTQRMKIILSKEDTFPAILEYNYAKVIRPRGELMIRNYKILPWREVLNLTDEEFVNKIGVTLKDLEEVKAEFVDQNNELDYKLRFFTKYIPNNGKNEVY